MYYILYLCSLWVLIAVVVNLSFSLPHRIAFFDFVQDPASPTGAYLYVTNDWVIERGNGTVPDDCYNLFTTSTGGGRENWVIKAGRA